MKAVQQWVTMFALAAIGVAVLAIIFTAQNPGASSSPIPTPTLAVINDTGSGLTVTQAAPPTLPPITPTTPPPSESTHVVQAGETLGNIAAQYCTTWQDIQARNGLADPNVLEVGQILTIPTSCSPN